MLPEIHDPLIFWAAGLAVVGYVLYMMLRRRKGLRAGHVENEPDL